MSLWVGSSLPNTFSSLVRLGRHSGVVYPKKKVKIREISVYFDHFCSLCDGQHCSVGLLWGIWIEPSLPNTPMLSVWPENHFEEMVKIWTISFHFDHLQTPCNGQHGSVGLLREIWIESSLPNTHMLSVRPGNHFEVIYLEKMVRVQAISVHFDHFGCSCYGQHCSIELLWGL